MNVPIGFFFLKIVYFVLFIFDGRRQQINIRTHLLNASQQTKCWTFFIIHEAELRNNNFFEPIFFLFTKRITGRTHSHHDK